MPLLFHYCPASHWARFSITGKLAKAAPGPRRDRQNRALWWTLDVRGPGDHPFHARCAPCTGMKVKALIGRVVEITGGLDAQKQPGDPLLQVSSVEDMTPRADNEGFAAPAAHDLWEFAQDVSHDSGGDLRSPARPADQPE